MYATIEPQQRKGDKMTKQELETTLGMALEQRIQEYALTVPTIFILDLLQDFRKAVAEVD